MVFHLQDAAVPHSLKRSGVPPDLPGEWHHEATLRFKKHIFIIFFIVLVLAVSTLLHPSRAIGDVIFLAFYRISKLLNIGVSCEGDTADGFLYWLPCWTFDCLCCRGESWRLLIFSMSFRPEANWQPYLASQSGRTSYRKIGLKREYSSSIPYHLIPGLPGCSCLPSYVQPFLPGSAYQDYLPDKG